MPCNADLQRAVQCGAKQLIFGNAQEYGHMNFLDISRYGHGRTGLATDICGSVLYDDSPTQEDKFLLSHCDYSFVSWVFSSAY